MHARSASHACCGFACRMARADDSQSMAVSCQPTQTRALNVDCFGGGGIPDGASSVGAGSGAVGRASRAGGEEAQAALRAAATSKRRVFIPARLLDLEGGFFFCRLAGAFLRRRGK